MTVKELIERLEDQDPDTEVVFLYNSGDYCSAVVAEKVETVEDQEVIHSDSHGKLRLSEGEEPDATMVVALS